MSAEIPTRPGEAEQPQRNPALQPDLFLRPDLGPLLINSVESLIIVLSPEGKIMLFNRACERLTGYTFEEVRNQPFWDLFLLDEEREPVREVFASLVAGQFPNEFVNFWKTRSGEPRLLSWSNTALLGAEGQVDYVVGVGTDITERRILEQALSESEHRYSSLFHNHNAVMLLIDPVDGRILDANPAACQFYGCSYESLTSKNIKDFNTLTPEQVAQEMENARTHQRNHFDFRHQLCNGQVRSVEVYSSPIPIGGKTVLHSIIHDVTERKEDESRRERHLEHLNKLVEVSTRVLAERDLDGLMCSIVEAARELIGARIAIAGHSFEDGAFSVGVSSRARGQAPCPPGERFKMEQGGVYKLLLEEQISLRMTNQELYQHPAWWGLPVGHSELDGLLGARLMDGEGRPKGILLLTGKEEGEFSEEDEVLLVQLATLAALSWQHIEARSDAEQRVEELDVIFNAMSEAIGICDKDGYLLKVNPALVDAFGFDPLGERLFNMAERLQMQDGEGNPIQVAQLPSYRALHGETVTNVPLKLTNAAGKHMDIRAAASPLRMDGQLWGAVLVFHDVSDLLAAEQALQVYADKLEQSNRDLEDFAFIASHDLQEPLRKIQIFSDHLNKKYGNMLGEEGRDTVERMNSATVRMRRMISDLLAYSRVNRGASFTRVDLNLVLREVLSDLEVRLATSKGKVDITPLPVIEADETQMRQLFQNLVGNALKFHAPGQAPQVRVYPVAAAKGMVEIWVEDKGIGFEEEYLERIFQPFQRLHGRSEYDGSGIGLAVCRKIAERHAGTITAHSQPGQGATFIIRLPVKQR